ncbi:MAG: hypothetical protein AAFR05_07610 [Bacteroidota bacterium]
MKTLILLLGLFGLSHSVAAQYSPNTPTELTLLGSGIALTGGGLLFLNDFPPISDETIQQLYTRASEILRAGREDCLVAQRSMLSGKRWPVPSSPPWYCSSTAPPPMTIAERNPS